MTMYISSLAKISESLSPCAIRFYFNSVTVIYICKSSWGAIGMEDAVPNKRGLGEVNGGGSVG